MNPNEFSHSGVKGMKWGVRRKEILLRDEASNSAAAKEASAQSKFYANKAKTITKNKTRADGTMGVFTKMRVGMNKGAANRSANRAADHVMRAQVAGKLARGKKLNGAELLMKEKIFKEEMSRVAEHTMNAAVSGKAAYDAHKSTEEKDKYMDIVNGFAGVSSAASAASAGERASAYS